MSKGVEQFEEELAGDRARLAQAQEQFNGFGREGDVRDFLLKGADDEKWEKMNSEEQDLYLKLCGIILGGDRLGF